MDAFAEFLQHLARLEVPRHRPVPGLLVFGRVLVAVPLLGIDVDDDRMIDVLHLLERGNQLVDVIALVDIQVVEPERLEEIAGIRPLRLAELLQRPEETAVVLGDGHLVVVEDDDAVAALLGEVVESLERHAARQRSIADDRDDVEPLALQVTGLREAASE